jgi:hypothetical protein
MRLPNTDSTPNKPVTLPRNQLLIRYAVTSPVHTVTIRGNVTSVYPSLKDANLDWIRFLMRVWSGVLVGTHIHGVSYKGHLCDCILMESHTSHNDLFAVENWRLN